MGYQDRTDIDQLLKDVDRIKFLIGDDDKALATLEALQEVANDLAEKYYDKSESYSKSEVNSALNGKANSSHNHGNILNNGIVSTSDTNYMNWFAGINSEDKIVKCNRLYNSHIVDSQSDTYTNIGTLSDNASQKTINNAINTKFGDCITTSNTDGLVKNDGSIVQDFNLSSTFISELVNQYHIHDVTTFEQLLRYIIRNM